MNKINIDKLHIEKLNYFEERRESLQSLKNEKTRLSNKQSSTNQVSTKSYIKLVDDIRKLEEEIRDIEECKSEHDYLFSIRKILKNFNNNEDKDLAYGYLVATGELANDPRESLVISTSCDNCHDELEVSEGIYTCKQCGHTYDGLCISTNLTYKQLEELDFRSKFVYEKKTYLNDWLNKFQAKDGAVIQDEVFDIIKKELKKERITEYSDLKEKKIREILKKLKLKEYYDSTINIVNILSGRKPFIITEEIRDKIHRMFDQIQIPHEMFKPESRKNFISYPYFIKKFFMILGLNEIADFYQYPKSQEKVQQLDETFIKIVDYMKERDKTTDWKFHLSF